jgi:hypothetical protein
VGQVFGAGLKSPEKKLKRRGFLWRFAAGLAKYMFDKSLK